MAVLTPRVLRAVSKVASSLAIEAILISARGDGRGDGEAAVSAEENAPQAARKSEDMRTKGKIEIFIRYKCNEVRPRIPYVSFFMCASSRGFL